MSVRVYGRVVGNGSQAVVTKGFATTLARAGVLAGLYPVDQDPELDETWPPGAAARAAVFTGPLTFVREILRGKHQHRLVMVAPNSTFFPVHLGKALADIATKILVPSAWAKPIVEGAVPLPVRVVPHGLLPGFVSDPRAVEALRQSYAAGGFDIVHFSSSAGERKGTLPLMEGFLLAKAKKRLPDLARLVLVLDVEAMGTVLAGMADFAGEPGADAIVVQSRLDASPSTMGGVYQGHHVVCQPSRGEGFGLCPVEALASGTVTVATACTGHSEWAPSMGGGFVPVPHGELSAIDDGPGARAPSVSPDAIAAALAFAYDHYVELSDCAVRDAALVADEWSWERQLAPFITHLKEITA